MRSLTTRRAAIRLGGAVAVVLWLALAGGACGGGADDTGGADIHDFGAAGGLPDGTDGRPDDGPGQPDGGTAAEDTAEEAGPCEGLRIDPPGTYTCAAPPPTPPHVVDGWFTGWRPECPFATHEWTCRERSSGEHAHAYFDAADGYLYVMNDWFRNDRGPIDPTCACRFRGFTEDGEVSWYVHVHGDQTVVGTRNGAPLGAEELPVVGATGFGRSPLVDDRDHSMCEIALPALPGTFGIALLAPLGGDPCEPGQPCGGGAGGSGGGGVIDELFVTGTVADDGTVTDVVAESGPALLAIEPPRAPIGAVVTLVGIGFGSARDRVVFSGIGATVVSWSDREIRAQVPPDARSGPVRVAARTRWSNQLPFEVICEPACEGRTCGADGCGGLCGDCQVYEFCEEGVCTCFPDCYPWVCGGDGCGGECECAPGLECHPDRICREPCEPQCGGRVCGPDGCDGVCGSCPGGWSCAEGTCVQDCTRSCFDKECGPDGCGGTCGSCPGSRGVCVAGRCECEPSCGDRECGDDGCDGSCGACPAGLACRSGRCVCIPDCSGGRQCGPDGCGGVCGTCAGGAIACQDGRCVCQPDCTDRACGNDGCGGSCGLCTEAQHVCRSGACVCLPVCGSRQCGDDGCGGDCGDCPPGLECDKDGTCREVP